MTRRELGLAIISPFVAKMIEDKVLPTQTGIPTLSFEESVLVPDGFKIFGWPEFQDFLSKTLELDITDVLVRTSKATLVASDIIAGLKIEINFDRSLVTVFQFHDKDSYVLYGKKSGPDVYFDKNFIALCSRMGFYHDAGTIEFTLDIRDGEYPRIVQTYQIMEPKRNPDVRQDQ